ncbi:amidohydrolase family protein [Stakelama saccharophila]|uniref:Amidohydrolase family protein n=1 Tax=Stakelama saccharophila TaxID=3075605 RepID=A0ABZ0BAH6_9SPHN|nr:amidohydrolase family protein [Stakelama sp. W311]WNO54085.1 amidohydrolase family protein [Stakelama sp. W311]
MPKPSRFIDAHVHLWELDRLSYPWLAPPFSDDGPNGSVERIAKDYRLGDYLHDADGWNVAGIVHIEAGADPSDALAETRWIQAMADAQSLPVAIVAQAALDDPDLDAKLAAHSRHRSVRGIRHIVNWHPDAQRTYCPRDVTGDAAWQHGFGLLSKHGLSFDLQCYPAQMPGIARLAERHPQIPVIVNHMGMMVPTDTHGLEEWRTGMRAIAALPAGAVKISGMGFAYRPWSIEQVRPLVLETIDMFGIDRCMFASNFPTDKLFGSFDQHLSAYDAITDEFDEDERDRLFAANAERIYRIK